MNKHIAQLTKKAQSHSEKLQNVHSEINKVIVGQTDIVKKLLIALVANGHVLMEGVPGLAKTLMIKSLSECVACDHVRLQFTPDLLPADITGTKIYDHKKGLFKTMKGPIFTNFVLADEINRAPPKVQSALLEAMQEKQISIQGETIALKKPFMVLATQNPIEQEGTYRLPEAQVDRFMFKLLIQYPTRDDEIEIMHRFTEGVTTTLKKKLSAKDILELQNFNQQIYADEKIKEYVADIVDATRRPDEYGLGIGEYIEFGASPRASLWLILAAKAHALMEGRGFVKPEDVQAIAHDVLRHRILLTYEAEADKKTSDEMITHILNEIKIP